MSTFAVPESSSPPSTPDSYRRGTTKANFFSVLSPDPSTTPAGPPPSSAPSFTPAGQPPSSVLGSSILGAANRASSFSKPNFGSSGNFGSFNDDRAGHPIDWLQSTTSVDDEFAEAQNAIEALQSRGSKDQDVIGTHKQFPAPAPQEDTLPEDEDIFAASNLLATDSPRGMKRSRNGQPSQSESKRFAALQRRRDDIHEVVNYHAKRVQRPDLEESNDVLLQTERLVKEVHDQVQLRDEGQSYSLCEPVEDLLNIWESAARDEDGSDESTEDEEAPLSVGPKESASSLKKANFLCSLLLPLHYPPEAKASNSFSSSRAARSFGFSQSYNARVAGSHLPIPKILLDWLNKHHDPYPAILSDLHTFRPNPAAHANFWDIILSALLRGKLDDVINILKDADFSQAGKGSGSSFNSTEVGNIRRVVSRMIQSLEKCPAVVNGDWDVRSSDWTAFRLRTSQANEELAIFAEGSSRNLGSNELSFEADKFGISRPKGDELSLSEATRKIESKVPWNVYQSLKAMYAILLGGKAEIISFAQDWVEAAIALTAWWDGEDERRYAPGNATIALHGQSRKSQRIEDGSEEVYLERLAQSFNYATTEEDENAFQIDTNNVFEVGLAALMIGDVNGVIEILCTLSLALAAATVEVAKAGGWFRDSSGTLAVESFGASDLLLNQHGRQREMSDRDRIMVDYAEALFKRKFVAKDENLLGYDDTVDRAVTEGWELGLSVLARLDDYTLAREKLRELLDQLQLNSTERVDKVLFLGPIAGMGEETRKVAERYADSIADTSSKYGEALVYYARAHQRQKLKSVLDLLVSFCLVQSVAYPSEKDLDRHLRRLLTTPQEALTDMARVDSEAAQMLHLYLSGYATLRSFYELRDSRLEGPPKSGPQVRDLSLQEKKHAAAALVATINSAADNVHGGLYDGNRGAVINVDSLLTLLGEALVFVNQSKRILNSSQAFDLLKAIEDLETVSDRVFSQCEDFFQATVSSDSASNSASGSFKSPHPALKKSISSMTASSGFSLIGSVAFKSQENSGSMSNSGVLVAHDVQRRWDWRKTLPKSTKGKDVLRILRLGLAQEVSQVMLDTSLGDD